MNKMDLKKYGITGVTEIVYNPSYDELFREEASAASKRVRRPKWAP